jgi:hypothetical protein
MTGSGMRPLDLPCGEQGKLLSAKAFKLAERDKTMSEQEKPKSFMQELDEWVEGAVITPLIDGGEHEVQNGLTLEDTIASVKKAIRAQVLESYKNGLKAGAAKAAKQPAGVPIQR